MRKILASVIFVLAFCGSSFGASKEIVYNLGADPRTIDPALNNASDGNIVIKNIFEGLVRKNFNDEFEPACAENWEISEDGLKWTFHLRENLRWSDGEKLTASHFRDAILRTLNAETGSPYAYYAFFVKNGEKFYNGNSDVNEVGVYAPDEKTLILELEYKTPLIMDYLEFPVFYPVRIEIDNKYEISNGAFKLENWTHGNGGEITLIKNQEYREADKVKINRLRFVMISDENTALAAFRSGRIDYMGNIPSQMLPILLKRGEAVLYPALGTAFCDFNVNKPPFDDPRVRKAFALAIDRRIIVDKILMGGQRPATGFICDLVPGIESGKDFRTEGGSYLPENANVEEAKRLLAEAGYPDGKGFPKVSYKYNSNPGNKMIAEVLQGMWKKFLGIEVELQNEEWKVFIETRINHDYDIARDAWILDFNDAANLLETMISDSPQNNTGYNNKDFDTAMKNASIEMDHEKRIKYLHEAEDYIMNDMPVMPIYFYSSAVMQSKRVKNIYRSATGDLIFRGAETTD